MRYPLSNTNPEPPVQWNPEKPRGLSTELTELTEIPLVGIRNIYTLIRAGSVQKARTQSTKTPKNKRATNATKDAMERRSRAGSRDVTPLHLAFTGLRVLQKTGENRRYKRRLELRAGFAIRRPFYHRATTHADGNESPALAKGAKGVESRGAAREAET